MVMLFIKKNIISELLSVVDRINVLRYIFGFGLVWFVMMHVIILYNVLSSFCNQFVY